jgi:formylglycine-generating enzyme required for sulfatase activity
LRTRRYRHFYIHTQKEIIMNTRKIFGYGARNLFFAIAVVFALAFTACDDGSDGKKTDPKVTWPADLTAVVGQTLSAISLASYANDGGTPGAFSWTTPVDSVGTYGAQSHNMTFTPTDTSKYSTVKNDVNVLVSLAEMEMIRVAGGTFTMGSPDTETDRESDETQWQVTLSAFSIGKYEVTQAQYEEVMGTNPSILKTGAAAGETQSRRPVEYVSWYDALVFCNKLSVKEGLTPAYRKDEKTDPDEWGTVPAEYADNTWDAVEVVADSTGYRLPTEAQWEYAARGGSLASGYKVYSGSNTVDDVAWYSGNNGSEGDPNYGTKQVGTKAANELGIHDMSGNVWEWCWDWYGAYPTEAKTDYVGASSGTFRVFRGGWWGDPAEYARSAWRGHTASPFRRSMDLGFRVLRPAP